MPEEPPPEVKESSDSSDNSGSEAEDESSSGEDSESEAKRANQLSYLHEQVCLIIIEPLKIYLAIHSLQSTQLKYDHLSLFVGEKSS